MRLEIQHLPGLPRLAWCAHTAPGGDTLTVQAGPWVDSADDWCFEGAWAGSFEEGAFDRAEHCMGSGVRVDADGATFVAPSHTLDRLYAVAIPAGVWFSNSLAMLLAASGVRLDPRYRLYAADLLSGLSGLKRYRRRMPALDGAVLRQFVCCNVRLTRDGSLIEQAKPLGQPPLHYEDLRRLHDVNVAAIASNAAHPDRNRAFHPFVAISSGYDSPACAVLAKAVGARRAVTFVGARSGSCDSGAPVAEALGLDLITRNRHDYLDRSDLPDDGYLISGTIEDIVMASIDDELEGTLFFTGFHGDKVWNRLNRPAVIQRTLIRGGPSGNALAEPRLHIGYVHLVVPFLAASYFPELHALSNSAEMAPWSVGGSYDRPIPRRIAEEAGVPRDVFGQAKRAISQPFSVYCENLEEAMTAPAWRDLLAYQHDFAAEPGAVRRMFHRVLSELERGTYRAKRTFQRYGGPFARSYHVTRFGERRALHRTLLATTAFHWAADRLVGRYRTSLSGTSDGD